MEPASFLRAPVFRRAAEKSKPGMKPDPFEGIGEDVPEQKVRPAEEQVAGVD
jgi:hypothetical protein